jgi:hypothetical protein
MKNVYLNSKDFNKVKPTKLFPNPNVIEGLIDNELVRIKKTCNITVEIANSEQISWHGLNKDSYILTSEDGHFPSNLMMTVNNKGCFEDGLKIGATNGRNLGTASIGIVDFKKAIKILKKNNFKIVLP